MKTIASWHNELMDQECKAVLLDNDEVELAVRQGNLWHKAVFENIEEAISWIDHDLDGTPWPVNHSCLKEIRDEMIPVCPPPEEEEEPEGIQKMGPLSDDHPAAGQTCPACEERIGGGAYVCLIPIGPGKDPEAQAKAREGRPYNAISVVAHWTCATGEPCAADE